MTWKTLLAGTTVLAIAGASFAYAEHGPGRFGPGQGWHNQGWHMNAADIGAFADARIAALHAGLELNAEQEKNWPAVQSALQDLAKQRVTRFQARQNAQPPANPVERLSRRADALEARGAALKKLADAVAPLYNSLDDAQKHRFAVLARLERPRFAAWHMHHQWRGQGGWQHPGMPGMRGPQGGPPPQQ
jgi:zinc resistance-associated protein